MNKKLRLLVTDRCWMNCENCCNKQYNLAELPVVENLSIYDEISITGGEPLLFTAKLQQLVFGIRMLYPDTKIYLYTAYAPLPLSPRLFDGITYSLHFNSQIERFKLLLEQMTCTGIFANTNMRLRIFEGVDVEIPGSDYYVKYGFSEVKKVYWLDNCPVPSGEDFMRLPALWR